MLNTEWWNMDERCATPTDNEEIATSEVAVIAGEQAVGFNIND